MAQAARRHGLHSIVNVAKKVGFHKVLEKKVDISKDSNFEVERKLVDQYCPQSSDVYLSSLNTLSSD